MSKKGGIVLGVLERTVSGTRCLVSKFDPARLSGPDARTVVELFALLEKLAAAGKLLAAGRLDETGAWADGGHRDVEAFLALTAGTSVGAARGAMGTARRVKSQPHVLAGLRAGSLSAVQAEVVAAAVDADPNCEEALLERSRTAGLKGLKSECDRVTAAARSRDAETANYERIYRERILRHRTLADGSGRIEIQGPLDRTAQIMAALEPLERELFEQNRKTKTIVHPDAVAFDATVAMAEHFARSRARGENECVSDSTTSAKSAKTRSSRPLAMIVVHVSHAAYEWGWTEPGEICEIEGLGPVPVSVARRLASDAIMKAVVIDGVDITRIAHLGRTIPAHLRTGVEVRDRRCIIVGCEIDRHLEIDHNTPVAAGGETSLENLGRLCHHHHAMKTLRDLRRIGPFGNQTLVTKQEYAPAGPAPNTTPDHRHDPIFDNRKAPWSDAAGARRSVRIVPTTYWRSGRRVREPVHLARGVGTCVHVLCGDGNRRGNRLPRAECG